MPTTSSGNEVPQATIVVPIIKGEIRQTKASFSADLTNRWVENKRIIIPVTKRGNQIMYNIIVNSFKKWKNFGGASRSIAYLGLLDEETGPEIFIWFMIKWFSKND
jgi:hypothetical protein